MCVWDPLQHPGVFLLQGFCKLDDGFRVMIRKALLDESREVGTTGHPRAIDGIRKRILWMADALNVVEEFQDSWSWMRGTSHGYLQQVVNMKNEHG